MYALDAATLVASVLHRHKPQGLLNLYLIGHKAVFRNIDRLYLVKTYCINKYVLLGSDI